MALGQSDALSRSGKENEMRGIGDYRYVAVLLPYDRQFKIDVPAYRRFLRYFLKEPPAC